MSGKHEFLLPEFVLFWAAELSTTRSSIIRLKGGINNHVYRCGDDQDRQWVIKGYLQFRNGERDRLQAESDFLRYAQTVAPEYTPKLFHVDYERRCVVLEYLDGSQYQEGIRPQKKAIESAVDFFNKLNLSRSYARQVIRMDAAEGFLSLSEHIYNVQARIGKLDPSFLHGEELSEARKILLTLSSELDRVQELIYKQISRGDLTDSISYIHQYVSPSDFGFHNAINTKTGVRFIDFEFAGWDDPAKAIIDFELQPKVPTVSPSILLNTIEESLVQTTKARCDALRPILKLKWSCILLSFLNKARFDELHNVNPSVNVSELFLSRISKIRSYLPQDYSHHL